MLATLLSSKGSVYFFSTVCWIIVLVLLIRYIIRSRSRSTSNIKEGFDMHHKGDYEGAIKEYTEAIRKNPRDWVAYNNRGNTYSTMSLYASLPDARMDLLTLAMLDFQSSLEIMPYNKGNYKPLDNIRVIEKEIGDLEKEYAQETIDVSKINYEDAKESIIEFIKETNKKEESMKSRQPIHLGKEFSDLIKESNGISNFIDEKENYRIAKLALADYLMQNEGEIRRADYQDLHISVRNQMNLSGLTLNQKDEKVASILKEITPEVFDVFPMEIKFIDDEESKTQDKEHIEDGNTYDFEVYDLFEKREPWERQQGLAMLIIRGLSIAKGLNLKINSLVLLRFSNGRVHQLNAETRNTLVLIEVFHGGHMKMTMVIDDGTSNCVAGAMDSYDNKLSMPSIYKEREYEIKLSEDEIKSIFITLSEMSLCNSPELGSYLDDIDS